MSDNKMFHFEDTTRVEDIENQEDRLIILDGTARLDYIDKPPTSDTDEAQGVVARLKKLIS